MNALILLMLVVVIVELVNVSIYYTEVVAKFLCFWCKFWLFYFKLEKEMLLNKNK